MGSYWPFVPWTHCRTVQTQLPGSHFYIPRFWRQHVCGKEPEPDRPGFLSQIHHWLSRHMNLSTLSFLVDKVRIMTPQPCRITGMMKWDKWEKTHPAAYVCPTGEPCKPLLWGLLEIRHLMQRAWHLMQTLLYGTVSRSSVISWEVYGSLGICPPEWMGGRQSQLFLLGDLRWALRVHLPSL